MKIQVRNHVFETNSSSMHSIAIVRPENTKNDSENVYGWELTADWRKDKKEVEINCPCVIDDDSITFERWPFRILSTMFEKIRYAIASYGDEKHFKEISSICEKLTGHTLKTPTEHKWGYYFKTGLFDGDEIPEDHIIDENDLFYDEEKRDYYRLDNNKNPVYDIGRFTDEVPFYGYVDHQSMGMLQHFLEKHKLTLEEFLKDPKYIVIIDGDEYCAWQKMFDAGICLKENFIETGLKDQWNESNEQLV